MLLNLVKDVLLIAGTLAILFGMNTRLAVTALVVIPGIVLVSVAFRARVRGAHRAVRRLLALLIPPPVVRNSANALKPENAAPLI